MPTPIPADRYTDLADWLEDFVMRRPALFQSMRESDASLALAVGNAMRRMGRLRDAQGARAVETEGVEEAGAV